ncbi:FliM/FliN family flagellar motor switch protein [Rubrivirga sp.]|uniref:FliM/FliN family flagellar motor switch protein n=1 Tax=Rubrivirga sp. TaxID=1885344 RepID=UPI003C74220D
MNSPDPAYVAQPAAPDAAGAKPYDFAEPRAFSVRDLRRVEEVHGHLSSALSSSLSARLAEPTRVEAGVAVEVQAVDFEKSRTVPTVVFEARIGPAGPTLALDVSPALALLFVDRHLGGSDTLGAESRELSDLERSIVEREWVPLVMAAFAEAWQTVPPHVERYAPSAARLSLAPADAHVVVVDLAVRVGEESAPLSICYLTPTLTDILGAPAQTAGSAPTQTSLDTLPLTLRAELGRVRLSVGDLLRLTPGDVIPLARSATDPVPVQVGEHLRFEARPGTRGSRMALHLTTPPRTDP